MKKYIVICIVLIFGNTVFSQSEATGAAKNNVGFKIGYSQGYVKDLNFSPLNYNEGGVAYALSYRRQSSNGKGILNVGLEFSLTQLKTKASAYLISHSTIANFEISYVRKVGDGDKFLFHLGGQYNSYVRIMDWQDYESFSFFASHGVGVRGLLSYSPAYKHKFSSSLFIPVFQYLSRPPYNGIDEEIIANQDDVGKIIFSGNPTSFNQYLAFDWRINYRLSITEMFDLNIAYLLRYQYFSERNKIIHLQHQPSIGLSIKF